MTPLIKRPNRQESLRRRWADATRHMRWDEADQLWHELMVEWLKPTLVDQGYWNRLLERRMAALDRKEQRSTITDNEWDNTHQDMNR